MEKIQYMKAYSVEIKGAQKFKLLATFSAPIESVEFFYALTFFRARVPLTLLEDERLG
jgi:hypothetical protein